MPEIIPNHVPSPRTALGWDGTVYRPIRMFTDGTVQVRGEDQLFSFKEPLGVRRTSTISGPNGWGDSASPPAEQVWIVTAIAARDTTSPTTAHRYQFTGMPLTPDFFEQVQAFGIDALSTWGGHLYMVQGNTVRVTFTGGLANDSVRVELTGYIMTLET